MKLFYIGLGSNIGEREQILMQAIALIGERIGKMVACSSMYETCADGSYCDRSLDIDLIACDDLVCHDETLILPHPRMHMRRFVLEPLCEIAPRWMHPILHRTASELLAEID